jgi:hypothetical protein
VDVADGHDQVAFLGRRLPPGFEVRVVTVPAGARRAYDDVEWRDALVVVDGGRIELECHGGRRCFGPGDLLCLEGLGLRALHSLGPEPAVLVAVSRRGESGSPA